MAGIQTSVQIMDRVSQPMMSMVNAMNIVLNSFEALDNASSRAIDVDSLAAARAEMANAGAHLKQINDSLVKSQDKTEKIEDNVKRTEKTAEKLDTAYRKVNSEIDKVEKNTESAKNHQRAWNSEIARSTSHSSALLGNIKSIVIAMGGTIAAKAMFSLSDSMAQTTARLDLMNDGFQTTEDLQDKIFQSSQRARADYQDTMTVVSRLGLMAKEAFKSNDEMIRFSELMNMQFKIGGSSTTEQQSAMYQLSQAMASGRLQGDEYRSIIENAPLLAKSIEDYMVNVEKAKGTMKDWSSDGLLTADVIKAAMFRSAEETEERFKQIPLTYADLWTMFKNDLIQNIQPSLDRLNEIANTDRFENFKNSAVDALTSLAETAVDVFDGLIDAANYVHDNWDDIAPMIYGIVAAYAAWEVGTKGLAIANKILTASSPTLWIMEIASIVGFGVTAFSHLNRSASELAEDIDITGQSSYIAAEKAQVLMNQYNELESKVSRSKEEHDKMNSIILQLENTIPGLRNEIRTETGYIDDLAIALKKATDQFYNLATAKAYYNVYSDKMEQAVKDKVALEEKLEAEKEKLANKDFDIEWNIFNYRAKWGSDGFMYPETDEDRAKRGITGIEKDIANQENLIKTYFDKMLEQQKNAEDFDALCEKDKIEPLKAILGNTNTIAGALTEDIQYLRDAAEREAINRFTTAQITVEMGGINNTVTSNQDLDGMMDYLTEKVSEELNNTAQAHNRS